jgi:hypothetical protein
MSSSKGFPFPPTTNECSYLMICIVLTGNQNWKIRQPVWNRSDRHSDHLHLAGANRQLWHSRRCSLCHVDLRNHRPSKHHHEKQKN